MSNWELNRKQSRSIVTERTVTIELTKEVLIQISHLGILDLELKKATESVTTMLKIYQQLQGTTKEFIWAGIKHNLFVIKDGNGKIRFFAQTTSSSVLIKQLPFRQAIHLGLAKGNVRKYVKNMKPITGISEGRPTILNKAGIYTFLLMETLDSAKYLTEPFTVSEFMADKSVKITQQMVGHGAGLLARHIFIRLAVGSALAATAPVSIGASLVGLVGYLVISTSTEYAFETIDEKYRITEQLGKKLEEMAAAVSNKKQELNWQINRWNTPQGVYYLMRKFSGY